MKKQTVEILAKITSVLGIIISFGVGVGINFVTDKLAKGFDAWAMTAVTFLGIVAISVVFFVVLGNNISWALHDMLRYAFKTPMTVWRESIPRRYTVVSLYVFVAVGTVLLLVILSPVVLTVIFPTKTQVPIAQKKVATMVLGTQFEDLDPHNGNSVADYMLFHNIFDTLVDRDPTNNSPFPIIPALASSYTLINPSTWEFKLRKGIEFSNGEPWDAQAAKASIDRLASTGSWGSKRQFSLWSDLDHAEIVDDFTVRIITKGPSQSIINNLAVGFMMPESIAKKYANTPITDPRDIIGTGPYRLTNWEAGRGAVIEANIDYWGVVKPTIQRVVVNSIVDSTKRLAALQAGTADISYPLDTLALSQLRSDPRYRLFVLDSLQFVQFGFDLKRKPFSDARTREAAVRAVDFETIVRTVLAGSGKTCQCLISPSIFGAAKDLDPRLYSYNPDLAKQLLQQAGYSPGAGPEILIISPTDLEIEVTNAVASQLNAVGFMTKSKVLDSTDFTRALSLGEYDISADSIAAVSGDPAPVLSEMFASNQSILGYSNPQVDALLTAANIQDNQNTRADLYHKTSEIVWADRAILGTYQIVVNIGADSKLLGFVPRSDELFRFQSLSWQE